jgi:NADH:ubiquinone oxidoreductase subunit 6 (subunit J)
MELMAKFAFGLYAFLIAGGAIMAVTATSLVRALVGLVAAMFGVAGMYLLLSAPFLAFMQILIYVGGITVLIFFAIMFTRPGPDGTVGPRPHPFRRGLQALLAMLVPGLVLLTVILKHPPQSFSIPENIGPAFLGKGMLTHYLLPFELISVALFIAMAGAVLLAWHKWGAK